MEIKASSTFDFKTVQALTRISMFGKANPQKRMRMMAIIAIALIAILAFEAISLGGLFASWEVLAALIFGILAYFYLYFGLPKVRYKALGQFANTQNQFVFKDDEMTVSSTAAGYSGDGTIKYSMLHKAMETKAYLFLYQNKASVYVIDTSTIQGGTLEDIQQAMMPMLKDKYVACNY